MRGVCEITMCCHSVSRGRFGRKFIYYWMIKAMKNANDGDDDTGNDNNDIIMMMMIMIVI